MSDSENKLSNELISQAFENIRFSFQQASSGLTIYLGISYFSFQISINEDKLFFYRVVTALLNLLFTITLGVFFWIIDYFVRKNTKLINSLDISLVDRITSTTAKATRLCIILGTLCLAAVLTVWLVLLVHIFAACRGTT